MNDKENPRGDKSSVRHFNARDLGLSLREVAVDVIKRESHEIQTHWYHSPKDVDLFIWKDRGFKIIKQQVTFYGQLVEWSLAEGVRTGLMIEEESEPGMKGSLLIRYDRNLQLHTVEQGVEILGFVPGLSLPDRQTLVENFNGLTRDAFFDTSWPKSWRERLLKILGLNRK